MTLINSQYNNMSDITLKSAKSLFNNLGLTIQDLERQTDAVCNYIKLLEQTPIVNARLLNVQIASMYLNYIYLDVCAAFRMYLGGLSNYEQRFAVKQLYVILNEGFKRIYGFNNTKTRNKSIWITYLGIYANDSNTQINKGYEKLTKYLSNFYDEIIFDKSARSQGAHYTNDYTTIYSHLSSLNAEAVTVGATHFMQLMEEVRAFIQIVNSELIKEYQK